jgi:hypothetical protein
MDLILTSGTTLHSIHALGERPPPLREQGTFEIPALITFHREIGQETNEEDQFMKWNPLPVARPIHQMLIGG